MRNAVNFTQANYMVTYTNYTDEQLMELLKTGDQPAFTEIYNRYNKPVYAYIKGFVKDPELTEDILHEVFIKIWEIRERLQIESSFSAYLFRVCHNRSITVLQKIASNEQLRRGAIEHLRTIGSVALFNEKELQHYDQLLEEALNILPPQRKKVFMLCREEGKSYDEAAAELGISRNTVKEHMVLAMRALKAFLADKGEFALALMILGPLF